MMGWSGLTELPVLSAHGALLGHLLSCQPLQDAVHVETVPALTCNCRTRSSSVLHLNHDNV